MSDDREKLQAVYNDLLALQDQTDQLPLAKALDAVGLALSLLYAAPPASPLDPYLTDLEFANTVNIAAARKYKARLEFMEARYGKIDWDASPPEQPAAAPVAKVDEVHEDLLRRLRELPDEETK